MFESPESDRDKPIDAEWLRANLDSRWLARDLRVHETIGSTNDAVRQLSAAEACHGHACLTENQTAGRGRFARKWHGGGRSLLMSFLLRGHEFDLAAPALTMAAAVGIQRALSRLAAGPCEIRWPNDILLGGRKVCGILVEKGPWRDPAGYVVGIGLNVNQLADDFPEELRQRATSISIASGSAHDRALLFVEICRDLEKAFDAVAEGEESRDRIRTEWQRSSGMLGKRIAIDVDSEIVEGMALGIESDGALVVRLDNGMSRKLLSGTVVK